MFVRARASRAWLLVDSLCLLTFGFVAGLPANWSNYAASTRHTGLTAGRIDRGARLRDRLGGCDIPFFTG